MNKILALLLVSLAINTVPLECMQRGRSGPSKSELKQAQRIATRHADILDACASRQEPAWPTWNGHMPKNRTLICLFMICLLASQTQVAALSGSCVGDKCSNPGAASGAAPAVYRYVHEDAYVWLSRLNKEVWNSAFQPPSQYHPIEDFIGGIVRNARDGGKDAVIAFLQEAEDWGFAADAVSYTESDAKGQLILRHLCAFNDLCEGELCGQGEDLARRLIEKIGNIRSIVSNYDKSSVLYRVGAKCFDGNGALKGRCFAYVTNLAITLDIPLSLTKWVDVDISRRHN